METRRQLVGESGIFKQDVFEVLLNYEVSRAQRYPSPLTLLHIAPATSNFSADLKKKSHDALTNLLNRTLRVSDVPAHFGEEFLVLLPSTDETGGRAVAGRILGHFRTTQNLTTGRLASMNAYIGLTSRAAGGALSGQELLAEASVAMNEARAQQSPSYMMYSDISDSLPKPK
jgi:GGDEF domain-containing protein